MPRAVATSEAGRLCGREGAAVPTAGRFLSRVVRSMPPVTGLNYYSGKTDTTR